MKKFLRILPFFLVFIVVFGVQTYWEAESETKPFLDPFGRAEQIGTMTPNRPVELTGDDKFAYLSENNLVVTTIDPTMQTSKQEQRPIPDQDIYSYTNYKLVGDDLFWVGKEQTLKWVQWQGADKGWSQPKEITKGVTALQFQVVAGKKLLLAGVQKELRIYDVTTDVTLLKSYPQNKVVEIQGALDSKGVYHVGALNQLSGELYHLSYVTLDTKTWQGSDLIKLRELSLNTDSSIDTISFGSDAAYGYFLVTTKIGKLGTKNLELYSFPVADPSAVNHSYIVPKTMLGHESKGVYGASIAQNTEGALKFVFVSNSASSPRVGGYEAYIGTLQNGTWKEDATQVSNLQKVALNPVLYQKGDEMVTLFTEETTYSTYGVYVNSNNAQHAANTNKWMVSDFTHAAMQVPVYFGSAIIQFFVALAWPCLSYAYLMYFVIRKEDDLYDRVNLHFWVSVLVYLVSQIYLFLAYSNLDNFYTYAPDWLHSNFAITLLFLGFAAVSFLFTVMFRKLIYERNAIVEFSYFIAINMWLSLMAIAYWMAY